MNWSLRMRVMVAAGVVLAVALGGSGLVLFGLVRNALTRSSDETLNSQIRTLSGMIRIDLATGDLALQPASGVNVEAGILPDLYEILADGHRGIRHTQALSDAFLPHPGGGTIAVPQVGIHQLPNGHRGRIASARVAVTPPVPQVLALEDSEYEAKEHAALAAKEHPAKEGASRKKEHEEEEYEYEGVDANGRKFHYHGHKPFDVKALLAGESPTTPTKTPDPIPVDIIVALDTVGLDQDLNAIGWLLLMVTGVTVVLSEWLMAVAVGRSLRPLNRLAQGIVALGGADHGQRVELPHAPAELAPVVDRLNELLMRIDDVLARERGFSADVSHELRTPLSGLLATIDVCLRKDRDAVHYQRALVSCRRITRQMQAVVVNLLDLTRLESGRVAAQCEPVDLPMLLRSQWRLFAERATLRHVTVQWRVAQAVALTDGERLSQVLANLLDNAVSYVDEGGTITITTREQAGRQLLTIANTGSLVSAEQAAQVFDRFWRADHARTESHQHCGLGLTLCRRLMAVLDGSITASSQVGGWFTIVVDLPAVDLDSDDEQLQEIIQQANVKAEAAAKAKAEASGAHPVLRNAPAP